jgi:Protein of unknown function (DUF3102)
MGNLVRTRAAMVAAGFDYGALEPKTANRVRSAAQRIRDRLKRTVENMIAAGNELRKIKDNLPHGQWGPWLKAEFGWSDRTALGLMEVAELFGSKNAIISDLAITPSAAYLLAAPSTPFEARQALLDRAAAGEKITATLAREIIGAARKGATGNRKILAADVLWQRFAKKLESFIAGCNAKDLPGLQVKLRRFADELENRIRKEQGT